MKLNNLLYAFFCIVALFACDPVDKDERFIDVNKTLGDDQNDQKDPNEITSAKRYVLLEDYTGQLCPNCPDAALIIEDLEETWGKYFIPVGIHAGNMAMGPTPGVNVLALRTQEGDEYYNSVGTPDMPAGCINRVGSPEKINKWISLVNGMIGQEAQLWLNVSNEYDEATRSVKVTVNSKGFAAISGKLQLWYIEDGLVGPQLLPNGGSTITYVHNHVFRASVNGTWGEDFSLAKDEMKTITREGVLNASWNADNVSIVAFVYNDSGVLQVTKAPVKPETAVEE